MGRAHKKGRALDIVKIDTKKKEKKQPVEIRREKVAKDLEAFLAAGGEIEQVPYDVPFVDLGIRTWRVSEKSRPPRGRD